MKEKEIGELFKETFKDFKAQPSDELWTKISENKNLKAYNVRKKFLNPKTLSFTIGSVGLFVAALFYFISPETKLINQEQHPVTPEYLQTTLIDKDSACLNIQAAMKTEENNHVATSKTRVISTDTKSGEITHQNSSVNKDIADDSQMLPSTPVSITMIAPSTSQDEAIEEFIKPANLNKPTESNLLPIPFSGDPHSALLQYSRDTAVCKNSKVVLFVKNSLNVQWQIGVQATTLEIYPEESDIYYVDVLKPDGKDTTLAIRVDVFDCGLYIPNAFTPNGDGINDQFKVEAPMDITNFTLSIFETSGRLIFNTHNINKGWDGTYEGKKSPSGAYLYIITYTDRIGEKHYEKGQIVLYR